MKPAVPQETIDVRQLRVGMHVHLDVGWMRHPFPLSSFRIDSASQIDTIRALGAQRVRWSPGLSLPEAASGAPLDGRAAPNATTVGAVGDEAPDFLRRKPFAPQRPQEDTERRRRAAAEHEALALAERQYGEAGRDLHLAIDRVPSQPQHARALAEALARALLDKMVDAGELCIRLLSDGIGDRSAMHPLNVGVISLLLGRALGWPEDDLMELGLGAMLHDIGKDELPERLRFRDEHLSGAELRAYEEHVGRGVAHAARMGLAPGAALVIAQHHEHADGSGFPQRIGAERMTPAARVVALVNRYDRLVNPPLGTRPHTPHEALSMLFAQQRSRFDSATLGAFIRMMGVYPPGSTVQLTDDRYAMVVGVNGSRPLKPRVLVHDAGAADAHLIDLEVEAGLGIRRSLNPQQLPAATLQLLAPRQRIAYFFEPAREAEVVE